MTTPGINKSTTPPATPGPASAPTTKDSSTDSKVKGTWFTFSTSAFVVAVVALGAAFLAKTALAAKVIFVISGVAVTGLQTVVALAVAALVVGLVTREKAEFAPSDAEAAKAKADAADAAAAKAKADADAASETAKKAHEDAEAAKAKEGAA